ncbi:hypothetical protein E2K80_11205 [Rhodophyticola sp. CCM32]|uniref:glycoside hydrolase family 2 protein n=1 Tax=Rhodophyticola sp. CCM32 TaxID=2916397 RepID=UPI00107F91CB|nr:glycoside hydrolase family 2 protein [Rhodophyticola sp. CCM32]QBY01221.1 hypothetical protein E2K80_11205 [Rhodophyticola sp. CCM32]
MLDAFEANGLKENIIVLFLSLSDHGENLGSHGLTLAVQNTHGGGRTLETQSVVLPYLQATEIARIGADTLGADEFLHLQWPDIEKEYVGENTCFSKHDKACDLPSAMIKQNWVKQGDAVALELSTDVPVSIVSADLDGDLVFSDSGFLLLPDAPKTLLNDGQPSTDQPAYIQCLNNTRHE